MSSGLDKKLSENAKKFSKLSMASLPGAVMLAIGISAKYSTSGKMIHPILKSELLVNSLLFGGGIIMLWSAIAAVSLLREKTKIENEYRLL